MGMNDRAKRNSIFTLPCLRGSNISVFGRRRHAAGSGGVHTPAALKHGGK